MTVDQLKKILNVATDVVGVVTGAAPIIDNVKTLAGIVHRIGNDLATMPLNPDGTPLTIEQAQAHLANATSASVAQDNAIRAQAQAALDENKSGGA